MLFDFGGTLDQPAGHWLDRFLAHYRAAGLGLTREQLDPAFAHATGLGYRVGESMWRRGLKELLRFLVDQQLAYLAEFGPALVRGQLGERASQQRDKLLERIIEPFAADSMRGLTHSKEVLTRLASRYRLGVVSNFYGNLECVLEEAGFDGLLKATIDSSRLGIFKPDPGIFHAALEALGATASETAMIGDSLGKDCKPARDLGMRTVWLSARTDDRRGRNQADHTIRTLDELTEFEW